MRSVSEYFGRFAEGGNRRIRRRRRTSTHSRSGLAARLQSISARTVSLHATLAACAFMLSTLAYALVLGGHTQVVGNVAWRIGNAAADLVGLSIREVTITGLKRSRPEDVLDIIGVRSGVSMIGFDAVSAKRRLEEVDWVASATILRQFPDRISIEVREREPFALWQYEGVFRVIDRDGVTLETFAVADYVDLPIVVGAGAAREAARLLNQLEAWPDLRSRLRAAARVAERRWTLYLTNGMKIFLPEGEEGDVFDRLDRLQREQRLLDRDVEIVDLRLRGRTVLRLSQEALAAQKETREQLGTGNRGAGI
jgi:cell division protein FtsQ